MNIIFIFIQYLIVFIFLITNSSKFLNRLPKFQIHTQHQKPLPTIIQFTINQHLQQIYYKFIIMRRRDQFQDQIFGKYTKVQQYSDSASNYESDSDEREQQQEKQHHLKRSSKSKTYLNKISDIKRDRKSFDQCQQKGQQKDDVLKKNRQSAKQCRQRKKIYISLLQKQVQKLKAQIEASKIKIKSEYQTLNTLTSQIDIEKSKFIMKKLEIQKKLFSSVNNNAANNLNAKQQTSAFVDSYLYKFDINGKYKINLLDREFEQIVRLLFDHKLLTFWEINLSNFQNNFFDMIAIQTDTVYHKIGTLIQVHRLNLFKIVEKIKTIKQKIHDQGQRIQYLIEQLSKMNNSSQLIQFLIHPLYAQEKKLEVGQLGINPNNDSFASFETIKKKVKM